MASDREYSPMKLETTEEQGTHEGSDEIEIVRRPRKTRNKIIIGLLAVLLVATTVVAVTFIVLYATRSSSDSSSSDVCQSEACFDLSVQILGAMDERADPCEDFYNFTCGNWDIFNGIRPGMAGYGTINLLQSEIYEELADLLEGDFTDENQILIEMQDLYDSCIAAQDMDINASLIPAIGNFYQDLGGWSLLNIPGDGTEWGINSTQFIREKRLGSPAFYSLYIDIDDDLTEYIVGIEQSGLTLGSTYGYEYPSRRDKLVETIVTVLQELAQHPILTDDIREAAMDIVQFETTLSQIWDYFPNGTCYTVEELYILWPGHDWLTVLRGVLAPSGVDIQGSSTFRVTTPDYFIRLNSVVQSTPTGTLENYAKWQVTWQLSQMFMSDSKIRYSIIDFKEAAMGKPSLEQRQECVQLVEKVLPVALGRLFADKILPSGYKEAVMDLVSEVREGLRQRMNEVDWLDSETRALAIEKLEAIESRVAYPEKTFDDNYLKAIYGEYKFDETGYVGNFLQFIIVSHQQKLSLAYKPPDRNQWFIPPTTVNAYYFPRFNQITILEAILQTPFFSTEWPLSMQYGALGMVLGHELTHGFDDTGRQYDKDGRRRMWWTERAVQAFEDEAQCFVEQYSNYTLFGISVSGYYTLGENIADNGGLRASYNAYKKVAQDSKSLPGLSEFTDDQLFFIAFGQLWCSYTTLSSFEISVNGEHSPEPIRSIGTVSNNEDFAEAFNCPVGSPMNPRDKCVLW